MTLSQEQYRALWRTGWAVTGLAGEIIEKKKIKKKKINVVQ